MKLQRSAGGLLVAFILAGGCAASTAGAAARSSAAPAARALVDKAPAASGVAKPVRDTTPQPEEPGVELRLSARFVAAPGFVRSAVRVKPHPDNRILRVLVDSGNYFRSSAIELDGTHSARTHFLTWSALPEGNYSLVATVYGSDGLRSQQTARFEVRAGGGSSR